jgi:cytoskeletal protein RodZ
MEPKGTFGPRLRQERERRQISLASIAANTKINQSLLGALERDDVSRWPSGIFRRAFIRSYATAIGLNPDEVWKEFAERFPDPNPPVDAAGEAHGRTDVSAERHVGSVRSAAHPKPERAAAARAGSSVRLEHARSDRVELVFRVSVPRSWVNLALRVRALASRGAAWPRSQNQNT